MISECGIEPKKKVYKALIGENIKVILNGALKKKWKTQGEIIWQKDGEPWDPVPEAKEKFNGFKIMLVYNTLINNDIMKNYSNNNIKKFTVSSKQRIVEFISLRSFSWTEIRRSLVTRQLNFSLKVGHNFIHRIDDSVQCSSIYRIR